jgi:adenine/guanine phosphoribosyltransferase-like PRPP-binding protein
MASRSPDEIRQSIERNRAELGTAVEQLRTEVVKLTDWRGQLRRYEPQAIVTAAAAGFVLAGGVAALGALTFGRGRRKRRRQELG